MTVPVDVSVTVITRAPQNYTTELSSRYFALLTESLGSAIVSEAVPGVG